MKKMGSKKMWMGCIGVGAIVYLSASGTGTPAAYGAIGMIITAVIASLGAKEFKTSQQGSD